MKKVIFASLIAVALVACGGETPKEGETKDTTATAAAPAEAEAEVVEAPVDTTATTDSTAVEAAN